MQVSIREPFITNFSVAAGGELKFPASGQVVRMLEASAEHKLRINDSSPFIFNQGLAVKPKFPDNIDEDMRFFESVSIVNTSGVTLTGKICITFGDFDDNRLQASGTLTVAAATGGLKVINEPATTLAVSGTVEVVNDVGNPLPVSGTVEVVNDVGNPLPVSGTVEITNDVGNPIPVSGTLTAVTTVGTITNTVNTAEVIATTFDSQADVSVPNTTATVILAAAATRKEAIITNPETTGGYNIRIGDSGVGAANGTILLPGEKIFLTTTGAIYAYHAKGSSISIPITEIKA